MPSTHSSSCNQRGKNRPGQLSFRTLGTRLSNPRQILREKFYRNQRLLLQKAAAMRETHSGLCSGDMFFIVPITDCLFCFLLSNSPFSLVFNKIPVCFWQIICANNFRLRISPLPHVRDGLLLC